MKVTPDAGASEMTAPQPGLTEEQVFTLIDVTRRLTRERDLDSLLNLIVRDATDVVGAERSTLFLFDEETDELWSFVAEEAEVKEIRLPLGRGIAGEVARSRQPLNIPAAYESPLFDPEVDKKTGFHTHNVLAVPLTNPDGDLVGVLQSLNHAAGLFADREVRLLEALASIAAIAIENARLNVERETLQRDLVQTLAAAIDAKDPVTAGHSERVTFYALKLGEIAGLGREDLQKLEFAAGLHDVGKIGIRDEILGKPGRFSDDEYALMKLHAAYTREILEEIHYPRAMRDIPLVAGSHHERIDGNGYPSGYRGEELPVLAKILAIVDVFDALVAYDRPYKKPMPVPDAIKLLTDNAGAQFDAGLVKLFVEHECYKLERRRYVRIAGDLSIEYEVLNPDSVIRREPDWSKLADLSAGGMLFTSRDNLATGSHLLVHVEMPDLEVDVVGQLVRSQPTGSLGKFRNGIAFINLSKGVRDKLGRYLVNLAETRPDLEILPD